MIEFASTNLRFGKEVVGCVGRSVVSVNTLIYISRMEVYYVFEINLAPLELFRTFSNAFIHNNRYNSINL